MTLHEAVEAKVAETGVERYRYLCLEHPDATVRAQYSAWVMGEPVSTHNDRSPGVLTTIPLSESVRLTRLVKQCPYRSKAACGCQGAAACALKGGADVPTAVCWECVKTYPL